MIYRLGLIITLLWVLPVQAQECKEIADNALRLACYDNHFGKASPKAESTATPAAPSETRWSQFLSELRLADESTPKGLGSDPASLAWARRDGTNYSTIKAAAIWEARNSPFPDDSLLSEYGWGPVAMLSINRNTLSSKRTDVQQAGVGLQGAVLDIRKWGFSGFSKISYTYRKNGVDATRSDVVSIDNAIVSDAFRSGIPYQSPLASYFIPRFGFVYEDIKRAKVNNPVGARASAFVAAKLELYPAALSDRLKFSAYGQRFVDAESDPGLVKRRETYAKASIEYLLYPPLETPTVQPSFALERSNGADLLNGLERAGITQFLLKIKIN